MDAREESNDVIFVFPNNESATITANKAKLAQASEVFKTQFGFPTTKDSGDPLLITITDISYESFDKMMKHICGFDTFGIKISEEDYKELLYAARKYLLNDLTFKIIKFLQSCLNINNLLADFEYIEKFDIKPMNEILKNACLKYSVEVIKRFNSTNPTLERRILEIILQSEVLVDSEFNLYDAIVEMWKKQQTIYDDNKFRQDMGKLVNLIRFPVMSVEELAKCGRSPSLLTIEQVIDLQLWVLEKRYSKTINLFSIKKRHKFEPSLL